MRQQTCSPASNPAELLHNVGLRATKSRIAVLHALAKASRPLSIKELAKLLPSSLTIDTVTLYRMMDDCVKSGIVSKIALGRAHATFELKTDDHHHIICTECHKIEDFEDSRHATLAQRAVKRSHNFSHLISHSFELYGLCNTCSAN